MALLIVSLEKLHAHFQELSCVLANALASEVTIVFEQPPSRFVGGLAGAGCEYVQRNRGSRAPVAPLLHLGKGLWIWLGYREEWAEESTRAKTRKFSFRSVSISIHFGKKADSYKPQVFRAEWAGWAQWNGDTFGFQAGEAAHPHWQFDALDSLPSEDADTAELLRDLLDDVPEAEVKDFVPDLGESAIRGLFLSQEFSRIHFASAAAWWKPAPGDAHAHYPGDPAEISVWVKRTLSYLDAEFQRLKN